MKLRVVGWTYYEDDLPEGENGWAARNAIIDDIKKHGYMFSGWAHQECSCCVPVLNDGKKYLFSQRNWGDIMAEAHGYNGRMDYARFAFMDDDDNEIRPKDRFDEHSFTSESNLNELFELEVTQEIFDCADHSHKIKLDDLPTLRYIDKGDTLRLSCNTKIAKYTVIDVDREKDLTIEQKTELRCAHYDIFNEERNKRAEKMFEEAKTIMIIKLENRD